MGLVLRWVFLSGVSGRAQRQHRTLLSAQEGEVAFRALVGVVTLLATLGTHRGGENSVTGTLLKVGMRTIKTAGKQKLHPGQL